MKRQAALFYIIFTLLLLAGLGVSVNFTLAVVDQQERYKLIAQFGMMLASLSGAFMILFYTILSAEDK